MRTTDLTIKSGSKNVGEGETHYVAQITRHPHYNSDNFDYDFCILKIYGKIMLDATRKVISLPDENDETPVGEFVKVLGWGNTMNPLESTDNLRGVDLTVIDSLECERMYKVYNIDIVSNKLCAAHPDRIDGKDACQGDSGGPLQRSSDGKLVGIVSFGLGCAKASHAGIYSRVSACRNWIRILTGV
jgi:trypsin